MFHLISNYNDEQKSFVWAVGGGWASTDAALSTVTDTDITNLCSRLNIALFDADGTKVKTVAQKEGDSSFGTVALTLTADPDWDSVNGYTF